jgi:hypothetical protein
MRLRCAALVATLAVAGVAGAKTTPAERCAVAKLAAANRKTAAELRCHETALLRGRPVDDGCLAFASAHFTAAFAHAERKGGCATTGDTGAVEAEVDAYVATLVGALPASTSTSTTTTTPTTTSTTTTTVPCADTDPVCNGSCATGTYTYDAGVGGCLCE